MKTLLIDAVDGLVIPCEGGFKIFAEMHDLLESFPNRKIVVTNARSDSFAKFGLDKMPYEVFTLQQNPAKTEAKYFETLLQHFRLNSREAVYFEHNPEAVRAAESVGIKSYYYDSKKRDFDSLKSFLVENL